MSTRATFCADAFIRLREGCWRVGLTWAYLMLAPWMLSAAPPEAKPNAAPGPQIDALVAKVREKDYGFRSLIHEIVASELFRSK